MRSAFSELFFAALAVRTLFSRGAGLNGVGIQVCCQGFRPVPGKYAALGLPSWPFSAERGPCPACGIWCLAFVDLHPDDNTGVMAGLQPVGHLHGIAFHPGEQSAGVPQLQAGGSGRSALSE